MSLNNSFKHIQKLFVGNLPWTVSHNELKMYFSRYGHVSSASVIYDRNIGMSKGYGFVVFSSREGFNNAVNSDNHFLEGKSLIVQSANT